MRCCAVLKGNPMDHVMGCIVATGMTHGIPCSVQWHRVVLDEAHTIKSHSAAITAAACALQVRFTLRIATSPRALAKCSPKHHRILLHATSRFCAGACNAG